MTDDFQIAKHCNLIIMFCPSSLFQLAERGLHRTSQRQRLPGHLLSTLQPEPEGGARARRGRAVRSLHGQLPRLPHLRPTDGL